MQKFKSTVGLLHLSIDSTRRQGGSNLIRLIVLVSSDLDKEFLFGA
jgi:hypothetical protein